MERWSEANTQENYSVTEDIRSLNSQLQVTHKQLSDIGNKIEGHWKRLSEHFTPIVAEVQRVSKCHTLIQSLRYESMEVREDAIQQAHVATYNWIFNTEEFPSSYDHPNVNYVKWLQKGAGVYWVTGKAGGFLASPAVCH